jgi:MFS family permease
MQGRVISLIISAATAISPLSLMVAGPLSDVIGILTWFWFGGVVCLLMGVGAFFILAVLNVESNRNGIESRPDDASVPVSASD